MSFAFCILDKSSMFSISEWSQKNRNINTEINGLQQRRNQSGTADDEKAAIDRRIEDLEAKRRENISQMTAKACQVRKLNYGIYNHFPIPF